MGIYNRAVGGLPSNVVRSSSEMNTTGLIKDRIISHIAVPEYILARVYKTRISVIK